MHLESFWKPTGLLPLNVFEACWNRRLFGFNFPPLRVNLICGPPQLRISLGFREDETFRLPTRLFFAAGIFCWASDAPFIFYPAVADGIFIMTSSFSSDLCVFEWFQVLSRNLLPR